MTSLSTPFSLETASTTIKISLFTITTDSRLRPISQPFGPNSSAGSRCARPAPWSQEIILPAAPYRSPQTLPLPAPCPPRPQYRSRPPTAACRCSDAARSAALSTRRTRARLQSARNGPACAAPGRNRARTPPGVYALGIGSSTSSSADTSRLTRSQSPTPTPSGLVDEQPQHPVRASRGIFELHELVSQPLEQGLNEDDEPLTQDRHRAHPRKANRRPNKNGPQGPSRKTKSPSGGFGSQALGAGSLDDRLLVSRPFPPAEARGGAHSTQTGQAVNTRKTGPNPPKLARTCIDKLPPAVPGSYPRRPAPGGPRGRSLPAGQAVRAAADHLRCTAAGPAGALREPAGSRPGVSRA